MLVYQNFGIKMKFLCTGDFHLKKREQFRVKVLKWLCKKANDLEADGVVIAGDLFDSMADFRNLKSKIRDIFDKYLEAIPVIIIAGNHDAGLSSDTFLGQNAKVLDYNSPSYQFTSDKLNVNIFGLPYECGEYGSRFLRQFQFPEGDHNVNVLLTHASLIDPSREYIQREIEDQEEKNEFLLFPKDFAERTIKMVLLGHWHRNDQFKEYNTHFLYPGSPLPTSKNELGKKTYYIVEIPSKSDIIFQKHIVQAPESWYYQKESIFILPGFEEEKRNSFKELLQDLSQDKHCHLIIHIGGYIGDIAEIEFKQTLEEIKDSFSNKFKDIELDWRVQSAKNLDKPLVRRFVEKANALKIQETFLEEILERKEGKLRAKFQSVLEDKQESIKRKTLEVGLKSFANRLG